MTSDTLISGADFSICRKYRFALWRIWDTDKPAVMFVGLNPSTANESGDDPTIKRVIAMSKKWGFGGVYMLNCFPFVSTDPAALTDCGRMEENNEWLQAVSNKCEQVVFAWGAFAIAKQRADQLSSMFPEAKALQINKDGSPKHPLYVRVGTVPVKFNNEVKNGTI